MISRDARFYKGGLREGRPRALRRAGGRAPLATKGRLSLTRQAGAARLYDVHATIETEDGGGGERLALKWELS